MTTTTPPTSDEPASRLVASARRSGVSAPVQTRPRSDGVGGRLSSRIVRVRALSGASGTPRSSAASAAIWPGPMALVTIATVSFRNGRDRVSVSAAASRSAIRSTRITPARRSAALNVRSAWPDGSDRRAPARMATTGRRRAAARAADKKARRLRMLRMSSRMAPVPGSRASQSSVMANPISAAPPSPTIWLNPTPLGGAQSNTVRHSAADCDTSATRPGCAAMGPAVAFSPMAGTMSPNAAGPITRTCAAMAAAARLGAGVKQMAAFVPSRPSAAIDGATSSGAVVMSARSGGFGRPSTVSAAVMTPVKPPSRRLASVSWPSNVPAPTTPTERGRNSCSGRNRPFPIGDAISGPPYLADPSTASHGRDDAAGQSEFPRRSGNDGSTPVDRGR